ncbi:ATP synthase F1 subunit gamma [Candidatus Daviesbacteria bacterium RIFCSPLOWO2_01_FULL_38_10]|uniref:ATP synthase gamma chain n=1 Tax=Candidatus Daviesbacteria bacterium GW2011_GWF2_38_6 TaxID=1618432 RepID=A0A0G0NNU8_9BACT|nr:MAG: ATP synthase gamma chain [Candidatus Daviesbacteria bacterium GW2011_GWA2_38_17]KKQ78756.1 MAG: ATP synthase gamma chain [Candidatus Daviesbacteria bacterium GW2011_GWF2_38_6]OGE27455.1 MAG: ATP synthase F1 subunit gamma [Candidatus Daviesbacteria bacterium RIFCSPHIGHO2_02_FULL_39_41]OGE39286.1 MAG: ATP synthase F1 subunit gamma [Candidatus Daviesbacteria bacterium RIFCSPLOWO2_01_FULL_38_10]OGE45741.1 MAG: ATP synthase F1 subunit gamma [Candidatus Daviesbacteria bacterium RIFCSPHIGHO2_1
MANTRELRRRIKSVKNTSQITRAMEMVAATKMKRAQNQAISGRPYKENLYSSLARLLPKIDQESHPLLVGNGSKTAGVVLLSTDKGLVGALNTNLIRTLVGSTNAIYYTVGKKGRSFVVKTGKELAGDFENRDSVTFRQAVQLTKMITDAFNAGEIGEVYLVYPQFISTLKQEAKKVKLLPISLESIETVYTKEFLFEPNVDALLDFILMHHIETQIYQALLETKASEHSSRMVAMKNATDNAKELVEDLTLTYNQTRQDAITKEILEISSASVAIE